MLPTNLVGTTPVFINFRLSDHNEAKLNTAAITEESLICNSILLSRIGARRKVNSLIALMC